VAAAQGIAHRQLQDEGVAAGLVPAFAGAPCQRIVTQRIHTIDLICTGAIVFGLPLPRVRTTLHANLLPSVVPILVVIAVSTQVQLVLKEARFITELESEGYAVSL
jgi:hypothetical protein